MVYPVSMYRIDNKLYREQSGRSFVGNVGGLARVRPTVS